MANVKKTKLDYQMEEALHKAWIRKHRRFPTIFTIGAVGFVTVLAFWWLTVKIPGFGGEDAAIVFFCVVGVSYSHWYTHTNGYAKAAKKREKERLEQKNKNRY